MAGIRCLTGVARPNRDYDADIIILSLDRTEETIAAIVSARTQTGVCAHIFVLDQGSDEQSLVRLAAAAVEPMPGPAGASMDCDVTLLASDRNLGVAGGRNLITNLGRGRVIVALDNDAVFSTPDTVARLVAALDAEPRLAAIGCRIVTDATGRDDLSSWGYPTTLLPHAGDSFDAVTFVGAGHAIRRSAWEQAGGYDDRLFFCWEEYDFSVRAIALGWGIRYRGDIVIRHKVSTEQRVSWTERRWFFFVRNRLYIERKLGHGWRAVAPRVAGYLVKGLINGIPVQTLRAIFAAWAMSPGAGRGRLSGAALAYLRRNDAVHRGSWLRRIRREVLAGFGSGAPAATDP